MDEKIQIMDMKSESSDTVISNLQTRILVLEASLEASDAKVLPPRYTNGLPSYIGTSYLTPSQARLQKFPHSMTKPDSLKTYLLTSVLSLALIYYQLPLLSSLHHTVSSLSPCYSFLGQLALIYAVIIEFYFGVGMNIYPFVYACVLRGKRGEWPTYTQVWRSEKDKEEERLRGEGGSPVRGVWSLLGTLPGYTFAGLVGIVVLRWCCGSKVRVVGRERGRSLVRGTV